MSSVGSVLAEELINNYALVIFKPCINYNIVHGFTTLI